MVHLVFNLLMLSTVLVKECEGGPLAFFSTSRKLDIRDLKTLLKLFQKPKSEDLNLEMLKEKLGADFNPSFMSVHEPSSLRARDQPSKGDDSHDLSGDVMKSNPLMTKELRGIKFAVTRPNGRHKEFGPKKSQDFRLWLWNLEKCPVRYKWIDLGLNVFPRFIRRGHCSKKKTCSYPAGMKCAPKNWKNLTVLLYSCLKEANSVSLICKWRYMILNILTECQCGC